MPSQDLALHNMPIPPHVRRDRIVDFDYYDPPGISEGDVYSAWHKLHNGPDIVWTPRNGGHWILTRARDIKWAQENFSIFSHEEFTIPRIAQKIKMPPLTVDPPNHAQFRAILNPFFGPAQIRELAVKAREITVELIESHKLRGGCEFVSEFARVMPVSIFLGIVDLPLARREDFVEWATSYIGTSDLAVRDKYMKRISEYLSAVIEERTRTPRSDLLSRIAQWPNDSRYEGYHEVMGMAMLVFLGGLDTVANMMSFTVRHLALHHELRRRLRDEPALIPMAAEEYLRRHGLSNTGRIVKLSTEYQGVVFAKDDMVMVPIAMSSMDDREYTDPLTVDFDRGIQAHNTFGNGPHKCVGAPLARAELKIFLQEWITRIPEFCLDPNSPPITHSGPMNGVSNLRLLFRSNP
jgi:cytochrome P450